jgi:hypothetical protein
VHVDTKRAVSRSCGPHARSRPGRPLQHAERYCGVSTAYGFFSVRLLPPAALPSKTVGEEFTVADSADDPIVGDDVLEAVNDAMVALHERHARRKRPPRIC